MRSTHHHGTPPNGDTDVGISPQCPQQRADANDTRPPALAIELTGPLGDQVAIPLSGQSSLTLGRGEDGVGDEVTRHDPHLARAHAVLLPVAKGWFLVPEPSMNGVYVRMNGTHSLQPGDTFIMGGTHARVVEVANTTNTSQVGCPTDQAQTVDPDADNSKASADAPAPTVLEVSGVEA